MHLVKDCVGFVLLRSGGDKAGRAGGYANMTAEGARCNQVVAASLCRTRGFDFALMDLFESCPSPWSAHAESKMDVRSRDRQIDVNGGATH